MIHQSNVPGAENCITCKTARFFKAMLSAAIVVSCLLALTSVVTMTSFGFLNIGFLQSLPYNRFNPMFKINCALMSFLFIVMPFPIKICLSSGPLLVQRRHQLFAKGNSGSILLRSFTFLCSSFKDLSSPGKIYSVTLTLR